MSQSNSNSNNNSVTNKKAVCDMSDVDVDNHFKHIQGHNICSDESSVVIDYDLFQKITYDRDHNGCLYSDEQNNVNLGYDTYEENDHDVLILKNKLLDKFKSFYG